MLDSHIAIYIVHNLFDSQNIWYETGIYLHVNVTISTIIRVYHQAHKNYALVYVGFPHHIIKAIFRVYWVTQAPYFCDTHR